MKWRQQMFGLIVLVVGAIYLVVLIAVTRFAYSAAKKRGVSKAKCWLAAAGGFLLVYLPVFWDHIPTLIAHQYYCKTEAGFRVYKTLDQWKAENPGVMEGLVENNTSPEGISPDWPLEHRPDMNIAHINQRFGMTYKNHLSSQMEGELFLHVWRWKYELQDKKTGEILARQVDYSSGNGYLGGELPVRFWLQIEHCMSSDEQSHKLSEFVKQFKGAKK
jgi:hypothetical protein